MYNRYLSGAAPQQVEETTSVSPPSPREPGILDHLRSLLDRVGGGAGEKSLFAGVPVLEKLDSGDLLLILVLIFLFRESEDEEWLIILALVLLMGL